MASELNGENSTLEIIGQIINGYTVLQQIDKSSVYLAFKDNPDNQVAIKIFILIHMRAIMMKYSRVFRL